MENFMNITVDGNDIEISTKNIKLRNSLGFAIFCDPNNRNIEAEILRVENDIELLSFLETVDFGELIAIIRSSNNDNAIINLKDKLGFTNNQAESIFNMDLELITSQYSHNYLERLLKYKKLLTDFLND
ncbi:MAG: hypothetical protein IIA88_03840 [Bacteroidetes bacterium]|nr:hypothetical protein [Bacteroidota bacterium]